MSREKFLESTVPFFSCPTDFGQQTAGYSWKERKGEKKVVGTYLN